MNRVDRRSNFSSYDLRGTRLISSSGGFLRPVFLFTRLLRGATPGADRGDRATVHFYSHASCEARLFQNLLRYLADNFYSHASCEARPNFALVRDGYLNFYSHASCEARLK